MFKCRKCEVEKPISDFYSNKNCKSGHESICKTCWIARQKQWSIANKAKANAAKKRWADRNSELNRSLKSEWKAKNREVVNGHTLSRRARLRGATVDDLPSDYVKTLKQMYPACLCCGAEDDLTVDHVVALANGGTHSMDNFQILCQICNSRKGIKTIDYRGVLTNV